MFPYFCFHIFYANFSFCVDFEEWSDIMNPSRYIGGLAMHKLFTEDHLRNLPTIRLAEISLENFKSVKRGEIVLNCGKKHIPYGTQAVLPYGCHRGTWRLQFPDSPSGSFPRRQSSQHRQLHR